MSRAGTPAAAPARVADWAARARSAGHPVVEVRPGRFCPRPMPARVAGMAPNEIMDIDRESARAAVEWVHVLMPTAGDLLTLGEAIRPPSAPAARSGGWGRLPTRRRRSTARVVAPVGPVAVSETRGGVTVHVLELPAAWLDEPVTVVRRPAGHTVVVMAS